MRRLTICDLRLTRPFSVLLASRRQDKPYGFRSVLPARCRQHVFMACFVALFLVGNSIFAQTNSSANSAPSRPIGIEGRATLELPRGDYRPRPLDDRTELILRIERITATNGWHRYEFHYLGLEPGRYSLAEYLIRPDGSRPEELSELFLHVQALLPEDHDGKLTRHTPGRFPFLGGYRVFLGLLALLWAGGLAGFVLANRKRREVARPVAVAPEPTFAERIRPLVEAAAAGNLSLDDKARLERLLMGFWREQLNLPPEERMAESLKKLKAHARAGELLRALERWLHQRGGATAEEVNTLLEPYRGAKVPSTMEGAMR